MVDIISRNARRLQQLSEDILDITRIETLTFKVNKTHFDLNDLIRKIVEDHKKKIANEPDITIETKLTTDGLLIHADKGRITQVINNLINNSMRFTTEGTIIISTEINNRDDRSERHQYNKNKVTIHIKDTGSGIDSEIFPRLFEKFVTKSSDCTGLGLYISKSIVTTHGGRIWARNNPNNQKGATFAFSIPIH